MFDQQACNTQQAPSEARLLLFLFYQFFMNAVELFQNRNKIGGWGRLPVKRKY